MTEVRFMTGETNSAPPLQYRNRGPYVFRPSSPGLAWALRYRLPVRTFRFAIDRLAGPWKSSDRYFNAYANRASRGGFSHTTRL